MNITDQECIPERVDSDLVGCGVCPACRDYDETAQPCDIE